MRIGHRRAFYADFIWYLYIQSSLDLYLTKTNWPRLVVQQDKLNKDLINIITTSQILLNIFKN